MFDGHVGSSAATVEGTVAGPGIRYVIGRVGGTTRQTVAAATGDSPPNELEWPRTQVLKFINEYKKHSVLWDSSHNHYKFMWRKNLAWKEISARLGGIHVAELKRKMNSLLASNRRQRVMNKKTGSEADGPWFAYKHFSFINDRYKPRKKNHGQNNYVDLLKAQMQNRHVVQLIRQTDPSTSSTVAAAESNSWQDTTLTTDATNCEDPSAIQPQQSEAVDDPTTNDEELDPLEFETSSQHSIEDQLEDDLKTIEPYTLMDPNLETRSRGDQFEAYGTFIAEKLRLMDQRTLAHVQKAIAEVIFEAEMGKYRDPSSEATPPAADEVVKQELNGDDDDAASLGV